MNALRKYYQCSKGHESVTMSNEQSLQDLLHKIAKEQKIENYELTVKPISSGGANYSSILYVATIANETQHLNLFIKEAAMKEKMREQLPFKIYDTEIYVYSKLKKFYRELEDKYHVPDEYRLYLTKFYGANTTYLKETLVFENLVSRGFSTHDRKVSVDWAYAVAAVTELAKLHSLSISFHKEYSEEFHHFVEEFTTDWVTQEFMDAMWISGFEHSLAVVREENKEKMKRFSAQVDLAWLKRMYQPIRCKVLTHSDFRHSNLMHKRKTKIAKEQNYNDCNIEITKISTGGANYSSSLYLAKISSGNKEDLDLFIKVSQIGPKLRVNQKITIFETERFVYRVMKDSYKEIEERHCVPTQHRLCFPEYYGADSTPPDEMLVLENLAVKGYVLHDRFKSINWEYAAAAVTELAKLHSLSLAYQQEHPKEFKYFAENHQYVWLHQFTIDSLWAGGFRKAIEVAPLEHKDKLVKFFGQYDREKITRQYDPLRCKVLTHGDYRPSNLMHRHQDDGSVELIVVDHQTIQIGCPVIDLLYLIFTGTDKEFRDAHFDELVQFYYKQLRDAMRRLDIDPETTYSKEDFEFEMKEKLPFGLALAAFALPIVTVDSEHAPELHEDMALDGFKITQTGALFPSRVNGVVDDYVRWGILKD